MRSKILLLAGVLATTCVQAQTPVNTSMSIVQKATATWCGPCGQWGWALQEDIMADNMVGSNPKAFVFALYGDGASNYYNAAADALTIWGQSWPNWGVNNINRTVFAGGGINSTQTRTDIKSAVDSFALTASVASTAFSYSIAGNVLTVNTVTEFWLGGIGAYNLAVYIVEDSVYGYQNGKSGNVYHHNVLRGHIGASVYGEQIISGSISPNQTVNKNYTYTITDNSWNTSRIKILTVLWKEIGGKWSFVNANSIASAPTGIGNLEAVDQLTVYPNPASGNINITGALNRQSATRISLVNALGQDVFVKNIAYTTNQLHENIALDDLVDGVYFLHIKSDGAQNIRKVIISK